jgi:hypothetical protein
MANYIPYTIDNVFLWYEGNDPDRATPFNGINLNAPIKQLVQNDEKIDATIKQILDGGIKATHLRTVDLDVDNTILLNTMYIKNSANNMFLTDKNNENTISIHSYKVDVNTIRLNGLNINYNTDTLELTDDNGNFKNIQVNNIKLNKINFQDIKSRIDVIEETVGEEDVDYLDFLSDKGYSQSFIRTGAFYAINNYYNFGSNDLQDAIVYDDQNDSETTNGFLFYADGKVENSTIYTGDVKTVGADVAEFYDADKKYNIGDVLEIGGEKEVTLYNGGPLAGVVSEKPGYTLNQNNSFENPVLIALKGRVKVNIDGKAKKGQYIIAYKNGKGKAVDKPSTNDQVIGIALEDAENQVLIKV